MPSDDFLNRFFDPGCRERSLLDWQGKPPSIWDAIGGGLVSATIGAFFWGMFASVCPINLECFPLIGVSFLVGKAVGVFGRGSDYRFGLVGCVFALLGSFIGNLVVFWGLVLREMGCLPHTFLHPTALFLIFLDQCQWFDLLMGQVGHGPADELRTISLHQLCRLLP